MSEKKEPVIDPNSGVNLSDKSRKIFIKSGEEIVGGDVEIIKDLEEELGEQLTIVKTGTTAITYRVGFVVLDDGNFVVKLVVKRVQVSIVSFIFQLSNLTSLSFQKTNIRAFLPKIFQLSNLTSLSLSGNNLSTLPPEIVQLNNLTVA